MKIEEIKKRVEDAILRISKEFKENRALYLKESDMKCRLIKFIDCDEKYNYKGNETYIIHTEVRLDKKSKHKKDKHNFVDIFIAEFKLKDLDKNIWNFSWGDESIGIELKFNYGNQYSICGLIKALERDGDYLFKFGMEHRYIVCFDHKGKLKEKNLIYLKERFRRKKIIFIYVDGSGKGKSDTNNEKWKLVI